MKISVVTVTYNAEEYLESCLWSVVNQSHPSLEPIIVDGNSSDLTATTIRKFSPDFFRVLEGKDKGIYDAMNKGIAMATGDVVGILNSDDFFPDPEVLTKIARRFEETGADVIYGDLKYVRRKQPEQVLRKWVSGEYRSGHFQRGWMPPHPTFYARKELFEKWGGYNLKYGSAADYELMLRFLHTHQAKVAYLPVCMVSMRMGGVSNRSVWHRLQASRKDLRAMSDNNIKWPLYTIFLKYLRKIPQFFLR